MNEQGSTPRGEELLAHGRFLRSLARGLVADSGRAEELVQDTWTTALEHPPRHSGSLKAWLAQILRRLAIKQGLRESERGAREEVARRERSAAEVDEPGAIAAEIELQRRVFECVERLREPYQSTLYLRYYRGFGPRLIAADQRIPVKTVKSRLARGLELLREDLDRLHGGRREAWVVLLLPMARLAPSPPLEVGRPLGSGALTPSVWVAGAFVVAAVAGSALYFTHDESAGRVGRTELPVAPLAGDEVPAELERGAPGEGVRSAIAPTSGAPRVRDESAHLSGRVLDGSGNALVGADVAALVLAPESRGGPRGRVFERPERSEDAVRTRSGAQGDFELTLPRSGLVRVLVEDDGFAPLGRKFLVFPGQELDLGAVVLGAGVFLSGRVVDELGVPVSGAALWQERLDEGLTFFPRAEFAECMLRTGADGRFALARQAVGSWSLRIEDGLHVRGTAAGQTTFPGEQVTGLEIVLRSGATIAGRVTGLSEDERSAASVIARSIGQGEERQWCRAELSAGGEFHFGGLGPGEARELVVLLEPPGRRPRPISEPRVVRAGDERIELLASSIENPSDAALVTRAERTRSQDSTDSTEPAGQVEILVKLPDGSPCPGALVALRGGDGGDDRTRASPSAVRSADRDGHLLWDELSPGRHELRSITTTFGLDVEGFDALDGWTEVFVSAGERGQVTLNAEAQAELRGRARLSGLALIGAQVLVRPTRSSAAARRHGALALTTTVDAAGSFVFRDLPLGSYQVQLSHPSRALPAEREVELVAQGVELSFELEEARLAGFVRDEAGRPVAGAQLEVLPVEGLGRTAGEPPDRRRPENARRRVTTDATGRFEISGLEAGHAVGLEISSAGHATRRVGALEPSASRDSPLEFTLGPAAALTVELAVGSDAQAFYVLIAEPLGGTVGVTRVLALQPGRGNAVQGLGPGAWRLELHGRGARAQDGRAPLDVREVELSTQDVTTVRMVAP